MMNRRRFLLSSAATAALLEAAVDRALLDEAYRILERAQPKIRSGEILVAQGAEPPEQDAAEKVYLIASLTKPMTAAGVMLLADHGELSLDDSARKFIPEFSAGDRSRITIRHLLTHTSGLPDQLPNNVELRRRHAPLEDFVAEAIRTPLQFSPGERYSYQSMGILLAAEIVERITGVRFRAFLRDHIFQPLMMQATALGLGDYTLEDVVPNQVEYASANGGPVEGSEEWDWNSRYWRDLGAPWGGAHSTASDVGRFLHSFLYPTGRPLRAETARQMIQNQTPGMRASRGLGFLIGAEAFGAGSSPFTFGHGGATGCLCWADPRKDLICVILTSMPNNVSAQTALRPISDLISTSIS